MHRKTLLSTLSVLTPFLLTACAQKELTSDESEGSTTKHYGLEKSVKMIVTSEAGDKLADGGEIVFKDGIADGVVINVQPEIRKQTITGIGTSFNESAAFVLAHLEDEQRKQILKDFYGEEGANFSLSRTTIASTDFSVEGKYTYAPKVDDTELKSFSIAVDKDGFDKTVYPGIKNEKFDLLPMIKEVQAIKNSQEDSTFKVIASAWTAPPWMKDIETYFIKPTDENNHMGTGGSLKPEYVGLYADYLIKYLDAYEQEGVDIWGLTPVNEPEGNSGQWESMHFSPESQNEFIKNHLGPKLKAGDHSDVNLLIFDQNRNHMEEWTDVILGDEETAQYVYGTAVHWYASTYNVYEDTLDRVHNKFPEFDIIHTEGTIDDLGKKPPMGIGDPEGFQESGWFQNDDFWWNKNATDWAYTAEWAYRAEDHPIYVPVHRYARNIIVSLNHWMSGWIDWNAVLDHTGGPNHAGNFCGAPIMINLETGEIYHTPIYYVLAQLSSTIRPGDTALQTDKSLADLDNDALHANTVINDQGLMTVNLLNTTKEPLEFALQVGAQYADVTIPANAIQTIRVQL